MSSFFFATIPSKPRHSREGGNPACMLMLLFPRRRKSTALDSRLRGNDDSHFRRSLPSSAFVGGGDDVVLWHCSFLFTQRHQHFNRGAIAIHSKACF